MLGLGIYAAFMYAAILLFGVTLTLPGFAGLILTIGVAADANVVIFERIKEEARAGKSVRAAIATGYAKGFRTIVDANVVTAITALILFAVATAEVKGFALMLLIGTVVSLITAVAATRAMLGLLAGFRWFENPSFMGAHHSQRGAFLQLDFMKRTMLWFAISGVVLLIGVGSLAVRGLNLGIDFKGGVQITFRTPTYTSLSTVRAQTKAIGRGDAVVQGRGKSQNGGEDYKSFQIRLKKLKAGRAEQARRFVEVERARAGARHQERLVELRPPDRAFSDHRDPLLAARDHALHHDPIPRPRVRRAGDRGDAPRRLDHRRRLLASRGGR